ncbi:hypothetical protein BC939DRAFT_447140 [Gamsiella multidivaricata]|uniref:uncharacterized protein n=1 Tax=Gamsiella multidivaricata TaxID=101098 RepID=UPI00221F6002|nr:uncharacterized protein BC939DRAFT_447140 [Gamsiella multidivaricata]KAG0368309.1 hypothetical protein BGZ54_002223 [Gamsiella multidivaricata]KAI7826172.1 hypothetical protein BC939DRAFT_447140 [Gamsiella multidivaricata]
MTRHPSALEIAEVLQTIASLLDPKSLVSASLVSHHWHACCTPILWSTITPSDWSLVRFSPRQLYAHAHLVHVLQWHSSLHSNYNMPHSHGIVTQTESSPIGGLAMSTMGILPSSPSTLPSTQPIIQLPNSSHVYSEKSSREHKIPDGHVRTRGHEREESSPVQERLSLVCLSKIIGNCANLQQLSVHDERDGVPLDIITAIKSLRFLQSLELFANMVVMPDQTTKTTKTATRLLNVQDMVQALPQLKRLVLRGTAFSFQSLPFTREATPALANDDDLRKGESGDTTRQLAACPSNSNTSHYQLSIYTPLATFPIQHLSLDAPVSEAELALLLQQSPSLESLDLPGGLPWELSSEFIQALATACPHLSGFSINASCYPPVPEDQLTALVRSLPPLQRFGARSCMVGDSTLDALAERCSELERLDISLTKGHQLSKQRLYEYLRSARKLKELEAEGVWILLQDLKDNQQQQQQQHVGEEAQGQESTHPAATSSDQQHARPRCTDWASRETLRRLTIGFTSPDRSIRQCSSMYTLLSSLTRLEHLQLSYTCLSLSSDSGIHQLGALKDLRTINIETCGYVALTQEDLAWMARTWPKLEKICVHALGVSRERQLHAWLKDAGREDVVIESPQLTMF